MNNFRYKPEDKVRISVRKHVVDAGCEECVFRCENMVGKVTKTFSDEKYPKGYHVTWDDGACYFHEEELHRVK